MSDTVILALITALSAIAVAALGVLDRRYVARGQLEHQELVAQELVKHNAS